MEFLRYIITPEYIKMDFKKIAIIKNWKVLINIKKVQAFFNLVNYYRKFIRRFKYIITLFTELIKKDKRFIWINKINEFFKKLKNVIINELILIIYDFKKFIKLKTDVLNYAFKV